MRQTDILKQTARRTDIRIDRHWPMKVSLWRLGHNKQVWVGNWIARFRKLRNQTVFRLYCVLRTTCDGSILLCLFCIIWQFLDCSYMKTHAQPRHIAARYYTSKLVRSSYTSKYGCGNYCARRLQRLGTEPLLIGSSWMRSYHRLTRAAGIHHSFMTTYTAAVFASSYTPAATRWTTFAFGEIKSLKPFPDHHMQLTSSAKLVAWPSPKNILPQWPRSFYNAPSPTGAGS